MEERSQLGWCYGYRGWWQNNCALNKLEPIRDLRLQEKEEGEALGAVGKFNLHCSPQGDLRLLSPLYLLIHRLGPELSQLCIFLAFPSSEQAESACQTDP